MLKEAIYEIFIFFLMMILLLLCFYVIDLFYLRP